MCGPGGGEGGTVSREGGGWGGRPKERARSGKATHNKFIPHIPCYNIYIQVVSQFFPEQWEKTHFRGPSSITIISAALKMKVSTSIKRGTTCCFEMTVFPSSTHYVVKPLLGSPLGQLAPHQHAAHPKPQGKVPKQHRHASR